MELSSRIKNVSSSATLQITSRAKTLLKEGKDVVNFAAGEPDFDTPIPIKEAAIKAIQDGFTKYTPSAGTPELRQKISEKFKKDNNLEYSPEQIVVSCGAKHSLYNLIQVLIDKNDQVLIPSPFWLSYPEMVKLAQGKPVILETRQKDGYKIDIDKLSKKISLSTKLLILNSPSNPAGIVYSRQELEKIAQVCVEKKIAVISDEIYEKIIFDNQEHCSIASLGKDIYGLTFVVNGVSKSFSMTGWRIGYMAGDRDVIAAVNRLQDHATSNPASISQKATEAAFSLDQNYFNQIKNTFQQRRDLIVNYLDSKLLKFISYVKPQGAFYIFINISKTKLDSLIFTKRFLDEYNVAAIPGEPFGFSSCIRISFATSLDQIKKGLERLEFFLIKLKTEKLQANLS